MSNYDFVIKKGDRLPTIVATLKDVNGAVDLSGATAKFIMRQVGSGTTKVNAAATVDPDQVNNKGKVSYAWAANDTNTPGTFEAEWEVTFGGGLIQTFPNANHLVVRIIDDLD